SFVHRQVAAIAFHFVQIANRLFHRLLGFHFDKPKTARPTGFTVGNHLRRTHSTILTKQRAQLVRGNRPRQVTDVQLLPHTTNPSPNRENRPRSNRSSSERTNTNVDRRAADVCIPKERKPLVPI